MSCHAAIALAMNSDPFRAGRDVAVNNANNNNNRPRPRVDD
jgi:hypothetical protein